jgi:hypothetical protein
MAKHRRSAGKDVERALHRRKTGQLKSGKGGKGGVVKSKKQAVAIPVTSELLICSRLAAESPLQIP